MSEKSETTGRDDQNRKDEETSTEDKPVREDKSWPPKGMEQKGAR